MWFQSYLSNRQQYVQLSQQNGAFLEQFSSKLQIIRYGVPQGSILVPLLFICYISGLLNIFTCENNKICLYADVANLIISGSLPKSLKS